MDNKEPVLIPRELFDFLMGVGEIEGTSFGDFNSGRLGRFWWRALLRTAENGSPGAFALHAQAARIEGAKIGIDMAAGVADCHDSRGDIGNAIRRLEPRVALSIANNSTSLDPHTITGEAG